MQIRIPIHENIALIIDDHGLELEVFTGVELMTRRLNIDQMLTLRDGCDAAFKLEQCKMRKVSSR